MADTEPVLKAGDDMAGVRRRAGKGQAWLLGTYVGHSGTAYRDPAIHAAVRTMLAACGVTPEHDGTLVLRKRVTPGREGWFFFNPTGVAVTEKVALNGWRRVCDLFGQPVPVAGNRVELTVAPLDVQVLLLEEHA